MAVAANSSARSSASRTGRPVRIDSAAAMTSWAPALALAPKPPPTATGWVWTWSMSSLSRCATSLRTNQGAWVETHRSIRWAAGSHSATTECGSMHRWAADR